MLRVAAEEKTFRDLTFTRCSTNAPGARTLLAAAARIVGDPSALIISIECTHIELIRTVNNVRRVCCSRDRLPITATASTGIMALASTTCTSPTAFKLRYVYTVAVLKNIIATI